jgi:exopolysaccharide/PEP-CTERM locus tyrosine autokinase
MSKIYEALEKAKQDRQNQLSSEMVAMVEEVDTERVDLDVLNEPASPIAECFRFLRAQVTRPALGSPPRSVLVTSALTGEGKTFVACNLAVSISQSLEEHVLLIDADLRNPSVHKVFGIRSSREGLATYLAKDQELATLLKKTNIDKLSILPAGNSADIPSELLSSDKMKTLIHEVKNRYADRFVIIDGLPLELTAESSVLANLADAVILVVRHGKTPRDAAKRAVAKIPKDKLLGVVYNGYDEQMKRYHRYGYYNYGQGEEKS